MSLIQRLEAWLNANVWRFFRAVFSANRDYPYHDYLCVTDTTPTGFYEVGQNQINCHGNQSKRFVSKSTLIIATEDVQVRFNDAKNVVIDLLANVLYEFKSNIWQVFFWTPDEDKAIHFYFEGVLPDEARTAH
jgi:hypothetical protein